jgi:hypothetical protein
MLGARQARLILRFTKSDIGQYSAFLISVDEGGFDDPIRTSAVVIRGTNLTVTFASTGATYQARVSPDGRTLSGTWSQRSPITLEFSRATAENRWRDPSPHIERFIPVQTDVVLEVLDWGGSGRRSCSSRVLATWHTSSIDSHQSLPLTIGSMASRDVGSARRVRRQMATRPTALPTTCLPYSTVFGWIGPSSSVIPLRDRN